MHVTCPVCDHRAITRDCTTLSNSAIDPLAASSLDCVPSSAQMQGALGPIAVGKAKLRSLEAEIQRVRGTLAALELERDGVKSYVTYQESTISPMRRIPPEILGQIFLIVRDISRPICFGDDALENVELWTLFHVCRFWRDVALSYSELWSQFNIVHQPFGRPSERDAKMLLCATTRYTKDCLLYSHSRPLDFVFHADESYVDVAKLLAKESPRWASVAFNNLPVLQALESEIQGELPNLCSLDVDALGLEWDTQTQPLQAFSNAPSLTRLYLNEFSRPQQHLVLPWHQITHFSSFVLREFLPILRLMPSLVKLVSVEDICEPNEIQDRILLPHLEQLEVTSNSPTTSQLFDALEVPKLSSLRLTSKRGFSRIYAAAVVQMIRRSVCRLKSLAIFDYATDSIFAILSASGDLEELSVMGVMYPSELLTGLGSRVQLPKLKVLALWRCEPDPNLATHLVEMIRGRTRTQASTGAQAGVQSVEKITIVLASTPLLSSFSRDWIVARDQLKEMGVLAELNWKACHVPRVLVDW